MQQFFLVPTVIVTWIIGEVHPRNLWNCSIWYIFLGGKRDRCRQGCKDIDGTPAVKFGDMCTCLESGHLNTEICANVILKANFPVVPQHPPALSANGIAAQGELPVNWTVSLWLSRLGQISIDDPQRRWERVGVMQQDKERKQQTLSHLVRGMWSKDLLQYVDEVGLCLYSHFRPNLCSRNTAPR
jgi:hypothetical protein